MTVEVSINSPSGEGGESLDDLSVMLMDNRNVSINSPSGEGGEKNIKLNSLYDTAQYVVSINSPSGEGGEVV